MKVIKKPAFKLLYTGIMATLWVSASFAQTVQPYNGRLNCKTLDQNIAQFSRLTIGRFCRNASEACEMQILYNKLDATNPLKQILQDRLQDYLNLQLEICETAFAANEPNHYNKYLSRTNPYAAEQRSLITTEPITPTTIGVNEW